MLSPKSSPRAPERRLAALAGAVTVPGTHVRQLATPASGEGRVPQASEDLSMCVVCVYTQIKM